MAKDEIDSFIEDMRIEAGANKSRVVSVEDLEAGIFVDLDIEAGDGCQKRLVYRITTEKIEFVGYDGREVRSETLPSRDLHVYGDESEGPGGFVFHTNNITNVESKSFRPSDGKEYDSRVRAWEDAQQTWQ